MQDAKKSPKIAIWLLAVLQLINPELPEVVRRFRAQSSPRHGRARVPCGQAYDRDREVARCVRHGVATRYGVNVKDLVSPPPWTRFARHLNDVRERVYETNWAMPVGETRRPCLPAGFDPTRVTFGVWMERGIAVSQSTSLSLYIKRGTVSVRT